MTAAGSANRQWWMVLLQGALMAVGLTVLFIVLAGWLTPKVPSKSVASSAGPLPSSSAQVPVKVVRRPRTEAAVGTVRAIHEAAIAAKILARVVEVRVKAGQAVTRDEVLIRLDDADLQARLKQAEAALAAALAARDRAQQDFERIERLRASGAASAADFDQASAARRTALAEVERAQQAVSEAQVLLGYATIKAPISGIVTDKRVEAGDMVTPGQPLLGLYDPTRMQLVATVREGLAQRLQVGQTVRGRLEALNLECDATVSEIVPEAQAASRSFLVKVTGPCPPGVYSGMFGRIYIPLDDEEVIVVPEAAVIQVGQLDLVDVVTPDGVRRRHVELGRTLPDGREVLSGLRPGEMVVLHQRAETQR
jgi:RND family efflux transporter MFP subunit